MEILGIGPLEFFFILLIALIVLGPNDMVKAGRTIGRFLNKLVKSPTWKTLQKATQEIKQIPTNLMKEANLEEVIKDIPSPQQLIEDTGISDINTTIKSTNEDLSAWLKEPITTDSSERDEDKKSTLKDT
jgi:Sec-independent protein translocase protein TatA